MTSSTQKDPKQKPKLLIEIKVSSKYLAHEKGYNCTFCFK